MSARFFIPSRGAGWSALVILLVLVVRFLGDGNLTGNELTKLIDARIASDPGWLPGASVRGLEAGDRQLLFRWLVGPLLHHGGFYVTSLAGRLAGYALLAAGLALLFRRLGLPLLAGLVAVLVWAGQPSLVAGEWILPGFEPKVFSYGLALLALAGLLAPRPPWRTMAALLGLSVSCHVLVGLHATAATVLTWWMIRREVRPEFRTAAQASALWLVLSALAVAPALQHLAGTSLLAGAPEPGAPPASAIYVFLRAPQHLDPAHWPDGWWWRPLVAVVLLAAVYRVTDAGAVRRLILYAGAALVPFLAGLLVARYDHDGRWLQYYWFRYADVMVPLVAVLALARVVVDLGRRRPAWSRRWALVAWLSALAWFVVQARNLALAVPRLQAVAECGPGRSHRWAETCAWIRGHTPEQAVFLVPPWEAESFPWLARRPMVGTFKQVVLSGGLPAWYRKMTDLGGFPEPWPVRGYEARHALAAAYTNLTEARAQALMETYRADYFVTGTGRTYPWPVLYNNPDFVVYRKP